MSDRIRLLPDHIANQIAAGEVVQRPASVVKELLENAIDAQAQHIKLIIKDAGKTLIQVIDDGIGMSPNDARLCFERHATSKIQKSEDLFNIRTMGFRGEALASIAAVAQVELKTRLHDADLGCIVRIEGGQFLKQEAIACPAGTSIAVKNLFFNVPARRKFLKSNTVEMHHILQEFYRIALANPHVHFELYHNQTEIHHLPANKLSRRIIDIFGKNYRQQLIPCREETSLVCIHGYIGTPQQAKKTRGEQFLFVNQRYVRHSYLHHAIMQGYGDSLYEGTYPFYCLFIETDPSRFDVNVHPTKTEVKFEDEHTLYAFMQSIVQRALATHHIKPSLDFEISVNLSETLFSAHSPNEKMPERSSDRFSERIPKQATQNWQKLFADFEKEQSREIHFEGEELELFHQADNKPISPPGVVKLSSRIHQLDDSKDVGQNKKQDEQANVFQLHEGYLVSPIKSGLLLVNIKAAQQRILYDRFLEQLRQRQRYSQQSLFPERIHLAASDRHILADIMPQLQLLGFDMEILPQGEILLKAVPKDISDQPQRIIEEFLEEYKQSGGTLHMSQEERIARTLAIRSSARFARRLSTEEMQTLIARLFASSNPGLSPQGERIFVILKPQEVAGLFK